MDRGRAETGVSLLLACLLVTVAFVPASAVATATSTESSAPATVSGGGADTRLPAANAPAPVKGAPLATTHLRARSLPPAPDADTTVTRIEVAADGSATWVLQIRTRLETDQQVEEYRSFQRRFRENTSQYVDPFRKSIRGTVANARNATDREMRATAFETSTSIQQVPRRWGVVTYRFRWTGFAVERDGRLVIGDVFGSGFFISADDSLAVAAPDAHRVAQVEPNPDERDEGVVSWHGRRDFDDDHPRVVLAPTDNATATESSPDGADPLVAGSALLAVVLLAVFGAVSFRRRGGLRTVGVNENSSADATAAGGDATRETAGDDGPQEDAVDEALLTDEDRIERLLADRGGRMRQKEIGDRLEWTKSKTSRVLSRMTDQGTIEKLRLGRENVIQLAEDESDGQS